MFRISASPPAKGEDEQNEVGCTCQSQRESAPGPLLKVTHSVNNAAAVGGSAVRFDRWLCILGSSAAEQMGSGAKPPYQTHREPGRNMRALSPSGTDKAEFPESWCPGSIPHADPSLPGDCSFTYGLYGRYCFARGVGSTNSSFQRARSPLVPK